MELRRMPKTIEADAQTWNRLVANGVWRLQVYAELCSKTFENRNLCNNAITTPTDKRLTKHIKKVMKNILEILRNIQQRTDYMWKRVRLYNDDEDLKHLCISRELTTSKLHDFLQFLTLRYDYEWEVKEMVVLELELVSNDNDVDILLKAWRDNRHAGGAEFDAKLKEFYKSTNITAT
ncbi:uncharacterized protein LOC117786899 [Drosophila innubila]|uniref:uncharacterized protein LOC117786899 n=1 Tax=Drosophila innubila TaxID=198719 RepID=UPI00148C6050|nr:uncharacterized protein LOC117786899 [Drosophila innubila]